MAFDPGAQALFNAAVTAGSPYSAGDQFVINNAFVSLRSSGWLARLDRMCFPTAASQAQGLIDWITLQTYAITGSMSFAPYLGVTGDGSTGCIDTGLSPSAATHFTLNNAMYGVSISSTRSIGAVMCVMGTAGDSDGECRMYPFYTGNQSFTSINHQFSTSTLAPPNVHGIYMENRPDATHMVYYQNTGVLRNDGVTATSLDTNTFQIAASRAGGVSNDFSTDTIGGFWIGQGASGDPDQAVLEGIIATFLVQIGVTAAPSTGANSGAGSHRIGRRPKKRKIKGVLERIQAEQVQEVLPQEMRTEALQAVGIGGGNGVATVPLPSTSTAPRLDGITDKLTRIEGTLRLRAKAAALAKEEALKQHLARLKAAEDEEDEFMLLIA